MANCSAHIAAATANKSMYNSCQRVKRFEKPKNFEKTKRKIPVVLVDRGVQPIVLKYFFFFDVFLVFSFSP
jgi:hypothetical protein